jgi:hypothetical protein
MSLTSFLRCDESSMKLVTVDADFMFELPPEFSHLEAEWQKHMALARDVGPTKLLQTEIVVTIMVMLGGKYTIFSFPVLVPIQAMGRTTSSTYYLCLERTWRLVGIADLAFFFERVQRAFCSDGDGALERQDRAKCLEEPGVGNLRTTCTVHMKATDRENVCALVPKITTALKHTNLSLRFGNNMKLFRVAFRKTLADRLEVRDSREQLPLPSNCRENEARICCFWPHDDH